MRKSRAKRVFLDLGKYEQSVTKHLTDVNAYDKICKDVKLDKQQLCYQLTQCGKVTPVTYLHSRRMQLARKLLDENNATYKDLHTKTGYTSQSAVRMAFTREYGLTPKEYADLVERKNKVEHAMKMESKKELPKKSVNHQSIVDYIRRNCRCTDITVYTVADMFNITPQEVETRVRKETQKDFRGVLVEQRVNLSKGIITSTNKELRTIAQECGFLTYSFFVTSFEKIVGVGPNRFRTWSRAGAIY